MGEMAEQLAITHVNGEPLAMVGSSKSAPVVLPSGRFFRLDYFEISPNLRGGPLGTFALAMIAKRALELASDGVVLTAFAIGGLAQTYQRAGATQGAPRGWNYPRELLPFTFERDALERLGELADGLLEDEET
jgi:hypothetical protein